MFNQVPSGGQPLDALQKGYILVSAPFSTCGAFRNYWNGMLLHVCVVLYKVQLVLSMGVFCIQSEAYTLNLYLV